MSDINTKVNGDSFESLACDLLDFVTSTVRTIGTLARVEGVSAEALQENLGFMASVSQVVGIRFADRGIALSAEAIAELDETGNDEDAEDYADDKAYDVVH